MIKPFYLRATSERLYAITEKLSPLSGKDTKYCEVDDQLVAKYKNAYNAFIDAKFELMNAIEDYKFRKEVDG